MDPLTRRPVQEVRHLDGDCTNHSRLSSEPRSGIIPIARPDEGPCASSREATILLKAEELDVKPKIEDLDFEFRVKIESLEVKKEESGIEERLCPSDDHRTEENVGFVEPPARFEEVHNAIPLPLHEPNPLDTQQSPLESRDLSGNPSQVSEEQQGNFSPRPINERRRFFMEAVELPPPRYTRSRIANPSSRAYSSAPRTLSDIAFELTMEKMKNPKTLERRSSGPLLNLRSFKNRMAPIGLDRYPTGLDGNITEIYFNRYFISSIWGGSPQAAFPRPTAGLLQKHGLDDWMFITLEHHPYAPQVPGAPGLYFALGHEQKVNPLFKKSMRVITRISRNEWQYMGQYELVPSKRMTKEEWDTQPQNFCDMCSSQLLSKQWNLELRVDVYLRKQLGRPPTWDEINRNMSLRNDKDFYTKSITINDVNSAISNGLTPVGIYTMKCVSYDKKFAQEIHKKSLALQQEKEDNDRKVQRRNKRCDGEQAEVSSESRSKRTRK